MLRTGCRRWLPAVAGGPERRERERGGGTRDVFPSTWPVKPAYAIRMVRPPSMVNVSPVM
jgi:hypothetical protein